MGAGRVSDHVHAVPRRVLVVEPPPPLPPMRRRRVRLVFAQPHAVHLQGADSRILWVWWERFCVPHVSVTHQEVTPSKTADEDCRACDLCIQVIDEKLAEGLSKRFGTPIPATDENDDQSNTAQAPLPASKGGGRTVLTTGRYR